MILPDDSFDIVGAEAHCLIHGLHQEAPNRRNYTNTMTYTISFTGRGVTVWTMTVYMRSLQYEITVTSKAVTHQRNTGWHYYRRFQGDFAKEYDNLMVYVGRDGREYGGHFDRGF